MDKDEIMKYAVLGISAFANFVALSFFIYKQVTLKRNISNVFIIQMLAHGMGFIDSVGRMILLHNLIVGIQFIQNVAELLTIIAQAVYYIEILNLFANWKRLIVQKFQFVASIICILLGGSLIFKNILYTRIGEPGFLPKVIRLINLVGYCISIVVCVVTTFGFIRFSCIL